MPGTSAAPQGARPGRTQSVAATVFGLSPPSSSATSQTYVDALKKAGKFDAEAQAEAAKRALTACIASISPAANAFIKSAYGDLEKYLANRIEAEVRKQKKEEPATLALPVMDSTIPDTKAIAATCAAATAAAVTQVAINQPGTGKPAAQEPQNE